jgi:hypothetical protein
MDTKVTSNLSADSIAVSLSRSLDKNIYHIPLTLKTYVPAEWGKVKIVQDGKITGATVQKDEKGIYVLYSVYPDISSVVLKKDKS